MRTRILLVYGAVGGLIYLFSELEGYFKGEEDNFLMTWYYTVRLIISELDVMFAKIKYSAFMLRNAPSQFFKDVGQSFVPTEENKKEMFPERIGGLNSYIWGQFGVNLNFLNTHWQNSEPQHQPQKK